MGQYYNIIIKRKGGKTTAYDRTIDGEYTMAKLMEHSWYNNNMVNAICEKLYKKPSQVAWVGDYANEEPIDNLKLYNLAYGENVKYKELHKTQFNLNTHYIVNHTKKLILSGWQYLAENIKHSGNIWVVHPLPLLTALGNGRGGGDYRGINNDLVGAWAWDELEIVDWNEQEELKKQDYKPFNVIFQD